jgi:hypothetical protein
VERFSFGPEAAFVPRGELTMRVWFRDELVMAIRHVGFRSVDVSPGVEERVLVYVARK